ncbi:hypothetical protein [Oceanicoccus sagamiensis]|uniref:Uracil-DNA glycosylase-like domain-containing protein n=1 Tax=Oceanicoccus sagamiensis TaxID=716816 RepID=A0A1X9NA40_9GAMM|nr:hypothetical protein [Oceanicoccus sagamiensis]ARN72805.1 hypothetical protein BST96_00975 [Oceanicoccus sagamiensis]
MNELQRQAYMEAMGVDCYIPRLHLPAAMPSVLCDMPELAEVPVANAEVTEVAVAPLPKGKNGSAAAMQALLGDDEPKKSQPQQSVKAVTEELVQTASATPVPQFTLSIVRGSNILIIDDGLPGHINPNDYLQLLHNIVFALGAGKQQLAIDGFVWPMPGVKNSQFDQSETAARQTLDAFLAKQVDQLKAQYIIVMGEVAKAYITGEEVAKGALHTHPQWQLPLICTNSASPMLNDGSLKRAVWNDLQPLLSLIKSS